MAILQSIQKQQNLFVGILTFLVALWLMFYVIPGLFASLFNSLIGNLILMLIVILTAMKHVVLAFGLAFLFIFLYNFSHYVVKTTPTPAPHSK